MIKIICEVASKISPNFSFPGHIFTANGNILADILISSISVPEVMRRYDRERHISSHANWLPTWTYVQSRERAKVPNAESQEPTDIHQ